MNKTRYTPSPLLKLCLNQILQNDQVTKVLEALELDIKSFEESKVHEPQEQEKIHKETPNVIQGIQSAFTPLVNRKIEKLKKNPEKKTIGPKKRKKIYWTKEEDDVLLDIYNKSKKNDWKRVRFMMESRLSNFSRSNDKIRQRVGTLRKNGVIND